MDKIYYYITAQFCKQMLQLNTADQRPPQKTTNIPQSQYQIKSSSKHSSLAAAASLNLKTMEIIQCIKDRVILLKQRNQQVYKQQQNWMSELCYAEPSNIKLKINSKSNSQNKNISLDNNYALLKDIVSKSVRGQPLNPPSLTQKQQKQNLIFARKNQQLELAIHNKMNKIEELDNSIREMSQQQYETIDELQLYEEQLRNILKFNGALEEAQKVQKQKRKSLYSIRHIREVSQSLKDQKCVIIRDTVRTLEQLNSFRKSRIQWATQYNQYQFQGKIYQNQQILQRLQIFVENIRQLKKVSAKIQENINDSKKVSVFTPKNSEQLFRSNANYCPAESEQAFGQRPSSSRISKKTQNSLFPKYSPIKTPRNLIPIQGLNSKEQFTIINHHTEIKRDPKQFFTSNLKYQSAKNQEYGRKTGRISQMCNQQKNSLEMQFQAILIEYQGIMKRLTETHSKEISYFQKQQKQFWSKYKVLALEKVYLKGILEQQTLNYSIIQPTILKCKKMQQILEKKLLERVNLQQKIDRIQQTKQILQEDAQAIQDQPSIKKNMYKKISQILKKNQKQQKSLQLYGNEGQDNFKLQQLKSQLKQKRKEMEQFAQSANLQGYKRTKNEIQDLISGIQDLEKQINRKQKIREDSGRKPQNKLSDFIWLQIEEVLSEDPSVDVLKFVHKDMDANTILHKLGKRLLLI